MSEPETVELRRYPSRKLYNKNTSSYIRLPEVAEMVRKGANIRVEDTETGEDVTRAVLLQIIMEQENQQAGTMLSADLMMDMQREYQKRLASFWSGGMPMPGMRGMGAAPRKAEPAEPAAATAEAAELKALRARLEELEKKVAKK
jgi:polyhydroxyalkanoate synthesis repressor PhaR